MQRVTRVISEMVAFIIFLSLSWILTSYLLNASGTPVPACSLHQLSITSSVREGAGGTDGGLIVVRNISSRACSLTGYPHVVAMNKKGRTITASHVAHGMLGGWDWTALPPFPKPPTVVLSNSTQFASDWYEYSENGPIPANYFFASRLIIGLAGSTLRVRVAGVVDADQGKMWVTPFVSGKTGTNELLTTATS